MQKGPCQKLLRGLNTAIMVVTALANSIIVKSLVTINKEITTYLPTVTSEMVSLSALIFMFLHPFAALPVNYTLDHFSIKIGLSINCLVVILGCLIRTLVLHNFWWVIFGNALVAVGGSFMLNAPAKYSAIWYGPRDRIIVTSILVFISTISGAFGAFLSPYFVKNGLPIEQGQQKIHKLIVYQLFFVGGVMLINLCLLRADPWSLFPFSFKRRTITSIVAPTEETNIQDRSVSKYLQTVKGLFTNRNFLLPFFTKVLILACVNNLLVNLQLIISPFGMTSKDAGLTGLVALLSGLVNSIVATLFMKKTKKYKRVIIILCIGAIFCLTLMLVSLILQFTPLYWIAVAGFGFFVIPIIPALVEYTCEGVYPVGEATITGILLAGQSFFSFALGLASTFYLKKKTKVTSEIGMSVNILILLVALFIFSKTTEHFYRMEDHEKKLERFQQKVPILSE